MIIRDIASDMRVVTVYYTLVYLHFLLFYADQLLSCAYPCLT
jgi:hypothetical protein